MLRDTPNWPFSYNSSRCSSKPLHVAMTSYKGVDIELLVIDFYQAGTHENFYAALKKYLKS